MRRSEGQIRWSSYRDVDVVWRLELSRRHGAVRQVVKRRISGVLEDVVKEDMEMFW